MIDIAVHLDHFRLRKTFTIARGSRDAITVVRVTLTDTVSGAVGEGECVPYARYGETPDGVAETLRALGGVLAEGADRRAIQNLLAPGAARNALDCAFWSLEAARAGSTVAVLAGLAPPVPTLTAYTLSLEPPEAMRAAAQEAAAAGMPLLKIKLGGDGRTDLARLEAVRAGAPAARLIIDANEGWTVDDYHVLAPRLTALGVEMVEQPFPAGKDAALAGMKRVLPVCADESCHDRVSLPSLIGKYDLVNIKLDKTGGLTEALALKGAAEAAGFGIMIGCMVGSSLAMAPALLLAGGAAYTDLDAPLLLAEDRDPPLRADGAVLHPSAEGPWR